MRIKSAVSVAVAFLCAVSAGLDWSLDWSVGSVASADDSRPEQQVQSVEPIHAVEPVQTVEPVQPAAPIRIGWIGAMTGPIAKYGSFQSAQLAQEDINSAGGIEGRPIEIIFEDGKGDGRSAAAAAQKLIGIDRVRYIVGGHCSPESLAIAPIAERNKVLMLAAITSNPKLTTAGDHIFRLTAVSTRHAELLVPYAMGELGLKRFAIVYEETDYARPPAERFAELVREKGGNLVDLQSYNPGETDFRSILARLRTKSPQALYVGVQSPDSAVLLLRQLKELEVNVTLLGNEITGNTASDAAAAPLFEGMIFAEPAFDLEQADTREFVARYKARFKVDSLPFGFWTAEAYDAVRLLSATIERCGEAVENVRHCLYQVKNYPGVSAPVTIDRNGDGVRIYVLKKVIAGKATVLKPPDVIG